MAVGALDNNNTIDNADALDTRTGEAKRAAGMLPVSAETLKSLETLLRSAGRDPRAAGAGWRSDDPFVNACLLAASGFPQFPCNIFKRPLTKHGVNDATCNLTSIIYWAREKPFYGFGVKTGRYNNDSGPSGLWVFDVDDQPGYARLAELEEILGPLPKSWTVMSPRPGGGEHRYFTPSPDGPDMKMVSRAVIDVKKGQIDQKGRGGYVIGAGSLNYKSRKRYFWKEGCAPDETPLGTLSPAWVAAMDKADAVTPKGITPLLRLSGPSTEKRTHDPSSLLIGEGPGYGGFNDPVYKNAIQYFLRAGVEAPAHIIIDALREMIAGAPKNPGRDVSRYLTGPDLPRIVERARVYVAGLKECENVEQ
jgi:hypothetical protein